MNANLERLAAALMLVDRSTTVTERGERYVRTKIELLDVLLVDAAELAIFEADVQLLAVEEPRRLTCVIAVARPGSEPHAVAEILKRLIPSKLLGSKRSALIWVPGNPVISVRGSSFKLIDKAVKRVNDGDVGDAAAITATRGVEADEVAAFMEPLEKRKPVVTWSVAVLSVALYGLQLLWGNGEPYLAAPRMGAALSTLIAAGEVWRLLAPMLLHGSIAHLAMNMLALFSFGTFLERFLGWRRYLMLYVLAGLGGSLASAMRPTEVLAVGASGGIWGLMLAGAALVTWPRGRLPSMVSEIQRKRAWVPVLINVAYSFQPGIDLLAHLGGGLTGGLLVVSGFITWGLPTVAEANDAARPVLREPSWVTAGAVLSGVALLGALGVGVVTGRPWELRSAPMLHQVSFKGATIELPTLMAASEAKPEDNAFVFGSLKSDPVAFVVVVPEQTLTDEEALDVEGELQRSVSSFQPGLITDFNQVVASELRHKEGRPFLFHRQTSKDGRVGDSYFLIEGKRMFSVLVLASGDAAPGWRDAAAAVPFSIRFDAHVPTAKP